MKKLLSTALVILGVMIGLSPLSAAEKEAPKASKTVASPMEELNYKYEKLIQLNYQRHNEVLKLLKDIREQVREQPVAASAPTAEATAPASAVQPADAGRAAAVEVVASTSPAVAEVSTPEKPVEAPVATPVAIIEATATPPVNVVNAPASEPAVSPAPEVAPAQEQASLPQTTVPVAATPASAEPDPKLIRELNNTHSFAVLSFIVSLLSLVCMGIMISTMRKNDEKFRRMLWKSEVDTLRDEVMSGRPHLKVEKSFDRLTLTNDGSVAADEIKLSLGPAPRTMKQRLRVLTRIEANEKAEVEIGPQQATDGQIYGTLEYKSPESGKLFKEQFILKVDGVTGELVPVSQAV